MAAMIRRWRARRKMRWAVRYKRSFSPIQRSMWLEGRRWERMINLATSLLNNSSYPVWNAQD